MINYKRIIPAFALAITAALAFAPVFPEARAQEDTRQFVELPSDIKAKFLARMRGNMDSLDDILTAITKGDMQEAAMIAERRLGFAHGRIQKMIKKGASDAKINEMIARIREMAKGDYAAMSKAMHKKRPGGGKSKGGGRGIGSFMPPEVHLMGREMHKAAYNLADTARAAKNPPTTTDYKNILTALNEITTSCRGCHDTFRVK